MSGGWSRLRPAGWHWRLASVGSPRRPAAQGAAQPRGMILVVVLIVITMLSLGGYAFSELMFTEYKAARLQGREVQARALAESAADYARAYLAMPAERRAQPDGLDEARDRWRGVLVFDDAQAGLRGHFALVAPPSVDEQPSVLHFGLGDESARLNLHTLVRWDEQRPGAAREALLHLPGMTAEIADALLDWIDADDVPRELGAESDFYARLEPPYSPPNRVPAALEELLLVRGISRTMLFGRDTNRNGHLEPAEASRFEAEQSTMRADTGDFGWAAYLTLTSAEGNRDPRGRPRIDLNQDNLAELHRRLSEVFDDTWATFIVAYRQFGPYIGSAAATAGPLRGFDLNMPPRFRLESVLDLVAVRVQVVSPTRPQAIILPCPFENNRAALAEYLPKLLDHVTVDAAQRVVGRINVNLAPRAVLLAVPGINPALVDEMITKRGPPGQPADPARRHATWLLVEGLAELETMKRLLPHLTGCGDVHRAQIVGYFDQPGPAIRVEVVLDATTLPPQLVCWQELGQLGRGYDPQLLGLRPANDLP